ncbi:uncharacterized protein LOC116345288 [Contarinia nasturtii]|uniref:uncharacterized protein LOC116345288 n=1 Tax=Contarinia nasturtii TaxID=265458 RepID=UPI0012D42D36|nr:uncharacterized protein LOC116345288 [Contarinia nasturtii]
MEISTIPDAEREASEVLHSLLPVERIEKKEDNEKIENFEENNSNTSSDHWENVSVIKRKLGSQLNVVLKHQDDEIVDVEFSDSDDKPMQFVNVEVSNHQKNQLNTTTVKKSRKLVKTKKPKTTQKKTDSHKNDDKEAAPSLLESSVGEVAERLAVGCECQGICFKDLQAESVYRHRLNIAELTKQEHDMYLMGVTMACLSNRTETNRHKERIRQRAVYVFQGKKVCLDAFIYLENVTQYHLKRIRRHVMVNGVVPRVHGNVRKKPHNALSLDLYKFAENFVKSELMQHTNDLNKSVIVVNEPRINLYQKFRENCSIDGKLMSYSTFRHFLKKQFPHVRFVVNRPFDNYANRGIKREKKHQKLKSKRSTSSNDVVMHNNRDKKIDAISEEYDTEPASDVEEICLEIIANENSNDSDTKNNEYQDIDFLESEDE